MDSRLNSKLLSDGSVRKIVIMMAKRNCPVCRGSGYITERHEGRLRETLECGCTFEEFVGDFESEKKIIEGDYKIIPYQPPMERQ